MKLKGNHWPTKEQTLLLRAGLLSDPDCKTAWEEYCFLVDIQKADFVSLTLLPLVYQNLKDHATDRLGLCKSKYRHTWCTNQWNWQKTRPLLTQLTAAGIDQILLLKGMGLMYGGYYEFGTRVIGDIDILIAKKYVPIAYSILLKNGWKPTVPRFDYNNPEHLTRWHALNFTHPHGMHLDLHWSLLQENAQQLDEQILSEAKHISDSLYIPNPSDLLFQICVHGTKYSPVPLIRWVADGMTLLKQAEQEIEWERIIRFAYAAKVCRSLYLAFSFLEKEWNAPIPKNVIYNLKHAPFIQLEQKEYWFYSHGYREIGAWYRYCLNRGYLTRLSRLLHIHQYLQSTARLRSPLYIPFYAIYWIIKKCFRSLAAK